MWRGEGVAASPQPDQNHSQRGSDTSDTAHKPEAPPQACTHTVQAQGTRQWAETGQPTKPWASCEIRNPQWLLDARVALLEKVQLEKFPLVSAQLKRGLVHKQPGC